jgi:hypothetical protein
VFIATSLSQHTRAPNDLKYVRQDESHDQNYHSQEEHIWDASR